MRSERRLQLGGGLVLAGLLAVTLPRLELDLRLAAFMLEDDGTALAELSQQVVRSEASRTLIVLVEGPTSEAGVEGARALEARLRADDAVMARLERLQGGPAEGLDEAVWRLYRPRLLGFAAATAPEAAARVSPSGLDDALRELQERLRSPASTLLARLAPEDPLLVLPRLFERLGGSGQGGLRVVDGRFVSRSGHGVLLLSTRASPLAGDAQAPLLAAIREAVPDGLRLRMGGIHRFSVAVQRSIEADIRRVSILSTLALLVLVLALFRSPRIAGLVLTVVGSGFAVGLAATVLVFGRVHGLTLAFGASLIGVSVDYAVHFFVHHTLEGEGRAPRAVLRELFPGLALGAATTAVGFVALGASSLPGLSEVALFAATGIAGALGATWAFLPGAVARAPHRAVPAALARRLAGGLERLRARPGLALSPLALVALSSLGLPSVRWNDDVAELTALDPALVAEEDEVRAEVSDFEKRRFVVATGTSAAAALAANDRVARALERGLAAGELERYRSLSTLLPSPRTQVEVQAAIRGAPRLAERLEAAASAAGFRDGAFAPFLERLRSPPAPPLAFADLEGTPLEPLARTFRVELEDGVGFLSFLGGVADGDALKARIEGLEGARWLDQTAIFAEASESYRARTTRGLGLGFLVVCVLVALRYRALRPVLGTLAPASLAVLVTVGALGLLGVPLDLVALTALLMVFSMGVDYGVFVTEAGDREETEGLPRAAITLLAVLVAWLSTLAGFGLLALSSHPAMRTIGLVASIGLTTSVLLVPLAVRREGRSRDGGRSRGGGRS